MPKARSGRPVGTPSRFFRERERHDWPAGRTGRGAVMNRGSSAQIYHGQSGRTTKEWEYDFDRRRDGSPGPLRGEIGDCSRYAADTDGLQPSIEPTRSAKTQYPFHPARRFTVG